MDKTGPGDSPEAIAISPDSVDLRGLEAPGPMLPDIISLRKNGA